MNARKTIGAALALACVTSVPLAFSDNDKAREQQAHIDEQTPGAQNAVILLEMWVKAGAPNGAFSYQDLRGVDAEGTFDRDILPLFQHHGVWGENTQSCASCHSGNTEHSLHEMDLTSYEGIMKGGDVLSKPPGVPLFGQSKVGSTDYDWGHSKMKARLRNNRMPPSMKFDISEANRDGPCVDLTGGSATILTGKYDCEAANAVNLIGAWVEAGAKKTESFEFDGAQLNFERDVKQLFVKNGIWVEGSMACSSCHSGHTEHSLHEMDLSSYEGIMHGGDVLSKPPGVPLFGESKIGATDYDWGHSKLKARLRNNRMPPGVKFDITEANRDGPIVLHGERGAD
jgi:hypothetical protein